MNVCPKTWMAESILVTLFCCLPFGIIGIVKASNVTSLYAAGNVDAAMVASADAKKWTTIGFICGIAGVLIYVLAYICGFAALMSLA